MIITILYYLLVIAGILTFVYTVYKVIWYAVMLTVLYSRLSALKKDGIRVIWHRNPIRAACGQKGQSDVTMETRKNIYHISILTSISTHGRWNIAKGKEHYYFEVRRPQKWFYKQHVHSGNESALHDEYIKEDRFSLSKLALKDGEMIKESEKKFLLVYPTPKTLTYTERQFDHLGSGAMVCGYEVVCLKELIEQVKRG